MGIWLVLGLAQTFQRSFITRRHWGGRRRPLKPENLKGVWWCAKRTCSKVLVFCSLDFSEFICFLQLGNVNTFINTFYFGLVKINFESLYESDNFPFEKASGGDTKARTAVLVVKDKIFIR